MPSWVGEFDFIRSQLAPLSADAQGAAHLTDDGAILDLAPGERMAVTADTLIAGRHFPEDEDPALVARKALRVNLSDLAAMGARPFAYTTSIVWPEGEIEALANGFVAGLAQDQDEFGVRLIGGDTTRANAPWTISVTAFGRIPTGRSLRRNRAKAGDSLCVTGTIGDSGLGLALLQSKWSCNDEAQSALLLDRYRLPKPRIEAGRLALGYANAAIDISDGLLAEARHMAQESDLSVAISLDRMPRSEACEAWLKQQPDLEAGLCQIATQGDDYELLVAVPPDLVSELAQQCRGIGLGFSTIGHFEPYDGKNRLQLTGSSMNIDRSQLGFTHF